MTKLEDGYIHRSDYMLLVSQGAATLGAETKDRRLLVDRQRSEAGHPISARGRIHLTKMAAFLVAKIKDNVANQRIAKDKYERHAEYVANRKREKSLIEREIEAIPALLHNGLLKSQNGKTTINRRLHARDFKEKIAGRSLKPGVIEISPSCGRFKSSIPTKLLHAHVYIFMQLCHFCP